MTSWRETTDFFFHEKKPKQFNQLSDYNIVRSTHYIVFRTVTETAHSPEAMSEICMKI